mgnify:CR=1 FL=1
MHDGTVTWAQLLEETAVQHGRVHARWLCEEASGAFGDEFTVEIDGAPLVPIPLRFP